MSRKKDSFERKNGYSWVLIHLCVIFALPLVFAILTGRELFSFSNTYYTTSVKIYVLIIAGFLSAAFAIEEASGVNLTSSEGFGARYFGLGQNFLGMPGDGTALNYHPAGIAEASYSLVSVGHTQKFWNSSYDDISAVLPLDSLNTLAMGLSRFGAQSFYAPEGSDLTQDFTELNVSDYLWVTAYARRFGPVDLGANLQVLLRNLDQKGLGMRGDFSAQYYFLNHYRVAGLIQGLLPSNTRWESSYWEYQPTDMYLGIGGQWPAQYFYGTISVALQTQGLFQKASKSSSAMEGGRVYQSPGDVFNTSGLAAEYESFNGLSIRMGIREFRNNLARMTAAFGLSYNFKNIVTLDYGIQTHESLTASHRVSLQINPFFRTPSISFVRPKRALLNKNNEARQSAPRMEKTAETLEIPPVVPQGIQKEEKEILVNEPVKPELENPGKKSEPPEEPEHEEILEEPEEILEE